MSEVARDVEVAREVARLFARLPVGEVAEREAQLRTQSEEKQSQLRRTVGERYRDLVEAGDSLQRMQVLGRRVVTKIEVRFNSQ